MLYVGMVVAAAAGIINLTILECKLTLISPVDTKLFYNKSNHIGM